MNMSTEVFLPELGENLQGGDVLDIKVKPGDQVTAGQTLLEVEAEKSTVEVPAPIAGRIARLLVEKGQSIKVGQALLQIDGADGNAPPATKEAPATKLSRESTERANKHGLDPIEAAPSTKPQPVRPVPDALAQTSKGSTVAAGPATRRLARELGVDLSRVRGTAQGGRVTQEDVKAHVRDSAPAAITRGSALTPALPDFARWGAIERQPMDGVRRKTAEHMSVAWSQIPHVTHHDLADITDLDRLRKQHEGKGPKLTVTAFALKAAAVALREFPQFNASVDMAGGQLVFKHYYSIGVAVDTDRGLLVPVIRDVDRKSIKVLAQELAEAAERAREKKVSMEDMRGGTFTITNLGGIGGTSFSPIVNWPEVAILGLSRGRPQPVIRDGQVVPRLLLPLSLSYDHRVIDGAAAARFTRRLADLLENPLLMLLNV